MAKDLSTAEAAQAVAARGEKCSEDTMRRLHQIGVVKPERDRWGKRMFGDDDVAAAREYLASRRSKSAAA